LLATGSLAQGRRHCDHAVALYDPAVHRPLAMLLGIDLRVVGLALGSHASWFLGYPEAALVDTNQSLKEAREMGQAGTIFLTLNYAIIAHFLYGNHATIEALANELSILADKQDAVIWKLAGLQYRGLIFAVTGRASEAVQSITPPLAAYRSTGSTYGAPVGLSLLAKSYADLGQLDDAWRSVSEAKEVIERTGERWFEAYVDCTAGEIALKSPQPDVAKAEAHFERALGVARQQQAKSWELRAATRMARLWRDQGKPQQARELLAPVYGWFTEGFDTRDLKEARALLDGLA
jgi:predicted ATPase